MPGREKGCLVDLVPAGHKLEFLRDKGGAFIAADMRARAVRLQQDGLQQVTRVASTVAEA